MSRLARVVIPGLAHHVTQRGNGRRKVFFSDADYALYLRLITEGCKAAGVTCLGFCLMPNHLHLILVPKHEDGLRHCLSKANRAYAGIINATDANFASLRVWRDLNQNGVTDAGELQTLAASGITAISVATTVPTIGAISGNTISAQAIVTYTGGLTGQIADVILTADLADTKFLGTTTITPAAALLPKLKGYGNVKDLQVAMSDGTAAATQLQTLVTSFKALPVTSTWTTLKNAADDIMFKWAGVDGVAKNDNAFNREGIAA